MPYLDPVIAGKAVYHCHIGEHEDNGMMQIISISADAGSCEAGTPSSIDREKIPSTERATCKPPKGEKDHDDHAALDRLAADLLASWCRTPTTRATVANYTRWKR